MQCELCERKMEQLTVHHLIPRQYTKRKKITTSETVDICSACHKQIHSLFTNKQLAQELNTINKLKNEPQIEKFLKWIKKQSANKRVRVHHSR